MISIIIPVYNVEMWLERCLNSVINQTLQDIEIICIDDASTDCSWNILKKYAKKDCRIRLLQNANNIGVGATRNLGLRMAKGEYIGFIDSDDFVALSFYKTLFEGSCNGSVDIVKGDIWGYNNETSEISIREYYAINNLVLRNKNWFCYGFTSAIFRKELLDKFNIRFPEGIEILEDPCFTIEAVTKANKVSIINDAMYFYTENSYSSTNTLGIDKVVIAAKTAYDLIINIVTNMSKYEDVMPISSFLAHIIQGIAMRTDTTDIEIRSLTNILSSLYENLNFKDKFFYSLIKYYHEKNYAISKKTEYFNNHKEIIYNTIVKERQKINSIILRDRIKKHYTSCKKNI